jgi:hypothetical protein
MSMELHVFFRGSLPAVASLNAAMKELELPLSIKSRGSLDRHEGFLPMTWRREETGVEFDVYSDRAALDEIRPAGVDPKLDRSANFRWGGDAIELLAAQSLAAAIAKLTNGIVIDPEGGGTLSLDELVADARRTGDELAQQEAKRPRGTRPADLKHYLKPLLKERSDLVLRGRHLFIRPVKHLLRGVYFERSSDRYTVKIEMLPGPLWRPKDWPGLGEEVRFEHVWQPYFAAWLMDVLRYDVFERVGKMTDLASLFDYITREKRDGRSTVQLRMLRVPVLRLAGELERAEAEHQELERGAPKTFSEASDILLTRDIDALCAACHAAEAETAKKLKLGDAWEPTPFPVELPKPARHTTAEPPFATDPWPPRPDNLIGGPPEQPGDVVFFRLKKRRAGQDLMLAVLTAEEAAALHQRCGSYCTAYRLAGGELLTLTRTSWFSPYDPDYAAFPPTPYRDYRLEFDGQFRRVDAKFRRDDEDKDHPKLRLEEIRFANSQMTHQWFASEHRPGLMLGLRQERNHEWVREERPMTRALQESRYAAVPRFGEYQELLDCANKLLEAMGHAKVG